MQINVQDLFDISFSRNMRYDMVSTYYSLNFSLFFNSLPHQYFGEPMLHDTCYDTSTMASLSRPPITLICIEISESSSSYKSGNRKSHTFSV
jgi:hypothetical protein